MIIPVKNDEQIRIVVSLAREIWTEHYVQIIGVSQVEYMLSKFQSFEAVSNQIKHDDLKYFLIENGKIAVGYCAVKFQQKSLYLSKLYVKSSERGKGFGRKAIEFIEKLALENNLLQINLNVNKNNTNSIKAYEKLGFSATDTVEIDIGNNFVMSDYVMTKNLN